MWDRVVTCGFKKLQIVRKYFLWHSKNNARVIQTVKTVQLSRKINNKKINLSLLQTLKLFFYIVATNMQAIVTLCEECLYAFVVDLCRQSIWPLLDSILHFFIAFEMSFHQKFRHVGNKWKSLGTKSGLYGGWMTCASTMRKWSLLSGWPSFITIMLHRMRS